MCMITTLFKVPVTSSCGEPYDILDYVVRIHTTNEEKLFLITFFFHFVHFNVYFFGHQKLLMDHNADTVLQIKRHTREVIVYESCSDISLSNT